MTSPAVTSPCVCPDILCPCQFVNPEHAKLVRDCFDWMRERMRLDAELRGVIADLSVRERDVLGLLKAKLSNDQIAAELGITERTVRAHTTSLYKKLGVKSRLELLA